jgi:hypothetical protein
MIPPGGTQQGPDWARAWRQEHSVHQLAFKLLGITFAGGVLIGLSSRSFRVLALDGYCISEVQLLFTTGFSWWNCVVP